MRHALLAGALGSSSRSNTLAFCARDALVALALGCGGRSSFTLNTLVFYTLILDTFTLKAFALNTLALALCTRCSFRALPFGGSGGFATDDDATRGRSCLSDAGKRGGAGSGGSLTAFASGRSVALAVARARADGVTTRSALNLGGRRRGRGLSRAPLVAFSQKPLALCRSGAVTVQSRRALCRSAVGGGALCRGGAL